MELEGGCLTCFQQPTTDFLNVQREDTSEIEDVLRHHFWYTEADFNGAVICQPCWEQVSSFHQFYVSAEELYRKRLGSLIGESELGLEQDDCLGLLEPSENRLENGTVEPAEDDVISIADTEESDDVIYNDEDSGDTQCSTDDDQPVHSKRNWTPKRTVDEEYIKQHVRYICSQCGHESETFADYKVHSDGHGIRVCFIECCGTKHFNRTRLLDHVRTSFNPEAFRCHLCQKNYAYGFTLQRHIGEAHSTESERKFKCNKCPKSFALGYQYKAHMRYHEDVSKECCGRRFKNARTYSDHYRKYHDKNWRKPSKSKAKFKCTECHKKCLSKALLGKHMMMHEQRARNSQNASDGE